MILASVTAFLIVVLSFPFLLRWLIGGNDRDWQTLSNVGQAYGAMSAILSGLALCGVALSVTLQWRQVVWARMFSARERHFELIKLMLEDPGLSHETRDGETEQEIRGKLVNNLWVSHWLLMWDIDEMDPEFLRSAFDELFLDCLARDWWRDFGPTWMTKKSRRHDEFMSIAWSSWHRSVRTATAGSLSGVDRPATGVAVPPAAPAPAATEPRRSFS